MFYDGLVLLWNSLVWNSVFWIELTNMRKYKHEIFRWNYVNLITCIHSNPMFFWYCSLISDIQIATCSRNSQNQPWNIMKIFKYFPASKRSLFDSGIHEPISDDPQILEISDWIKSGPERIRKIRPHQSLDSWIACSVSNRFLTFGW